MYLLVMPPSADSVETSNKSAKKFEVTQRVVVGEKLEGQRRHITDFSTALCSCIFSAL